MQPIERTTLSLSRLLVLALAAFGAIGGAEATSANTDATDIWWNRNKPGNGYQLVNTGTFIFATGYLYGQDRAPVWMSAELEKTGPGTFSGPLYVTTGPWYGGPYDPATVTFRQAGTMTFALTSVTTGQLSYTVDGVAVDESLERQPLTLDFYGGSYKALLTVTATNCANPAQNGDYTAAVDIVTMHNGGAMTQTWTAGGAVTTYTGTYAQAGRMGTFESTWTSTAGGTGTMTMFQMTNQPFVFIARTLIQNSSNGCRQDGEIVGLIPR